VLLGSLGGLGLAALWLQVLQFGVIGGSSRSAQEGLSTGKFLEKLEIRKIILNTFRTR